MDEIGVKAISLKDLTKAIRQVNQDVPKQLSRAFKELAERFAERASRKVPRRTGRAAGSYKARASQKGGAIAIGGSKAPYAPWLDFGGRVGRGGSVLRTFIKEGRYLYPTLKEGKPEIIAGIEKVVDDTLLRAGTPAE